MLVHLYTDISEEITVNPIILKLGISTYSFPWSFGVPGYAGTPEGYHYDRKADEARMLDINEYVFRHFKEPISISDVAMVANMTETSFCRYFKSRTLEPFVRFLNEVRISYACKLLNNDNYSITEACFESGYNSLSYFNRQFRNIMGMSPLQYKQWKHKAIKMSSGPIVGGAKV